MTEPKFEHTHGSYSCRYTMPTEEIVDDLDWQPDPRDPEDPLHYVPGWAMLHYSRNNSPVEFYHKDELLFTLQPEYEKVDSPGVVFHTLSAEEFPELSERQRTLFTIHMKYNELEVRNMDGELVQTTFKGRSMISRMIDVDPWIIMLSWEWNPIAFMGIIKKDDFFRDIQKSSGDDLTSIMQAMSLQISASRQADPGERNRTGLCVNDNYGFSFYYDNKGIYLTESRYFPFDRLYSGDLDLDEDPDVANSRTLF